MSLFQVVRSSAGRVIRLIGCKTVPSYLKSIRIPPAWKDVMASSDENAKLLVTGHDVAGRKQCIYSTMHTEKAARCKFRRVRKLIACKEAIRSQIELEIKRQGQWDEEAILAYLIFETGIRPGSNVDTRAAKKAFGATTLQARHIKIMNSGRVWLKFSGKKGVQIHVRVTNPWLVEELIRRKETCDTAYSRVFESSDARLRTFVAMLNDGSFTPKDLRTARGCEIAQELANAVKRVPASNTKRKQIERRIVAEVAKELGNTPAVCRSSYIEPSILAKFAPSK